MRNGRHIRTVVLEILEIGLLRLRRFGHEGDAAACHREAYHLHNLPRLASNPSIGALEYYLTVEREQFVRDDPQARLEYGPAWERLEVDLEEAKRRSWLPWFGRRQA